VRELQLALSYKAHPAARDQLYALFVHKWGEPRAAMYNEKVMVFRDGQPRVEVVDDAEHDAWRIEIR
jgi:hypothetical protein